MSAPEIPSEDEDIDNPELVRWSPRQGPAVGDGTSLGVCLLALVGAAAIGAVGIGAVAVGVLAIGHLAVGRGRVKDLRIGRLEVGDLLVKRRSGRPF